MRKRLQEIAFDAGERIYRDIDETSGPLSPKRLRELFVPLSNMDLINMNILVNRTDYTGKSMERISSESVIDAGIALGIKYTLLYGVLGSMLYVSLKNLIN